MLNRLRIANFALIDRLEVEFQSGLNVLTGETGAGKSIIIDAIQFMLGNRANVELIRTGEARASVEGVFEVAPQVLETVRNVAGNLDFDREIIVRREIQRNGRSRALINDQVATAAAVRELAALILEIYGQGEQYELGESSVQMTLLDDFAGCGDLRRGVGEIFKRYQTSARRLEELRSEHAARERVKEYAAFQLREIEDVAARVGEDEELTAERKLLVQGERAMSLSAEVYGQLYESDDSLLAQIAAAGRKVSELIEVGAISENHAQELETAEASVTEVAAAVRSFAASFEFSAARLQQVEERLERLETLKRKYGGSLEAVEAMRAELAQQSEELESFAGQARELIEVLKRTEAEYLTAARELSGRRQAAAEQLERQVIRELRDLHMERVRLRISITPRTSGEAKTIDESASEREHTRVGVNSSGVKTSPSSAIKPAIKPAIKAAMETATEAANERTAEEDWRVRGRGWTAHGIDEIEFWLSVNEGEDLKPLAQVASGGELSRIMLTLRTVCSRYGREQSKTADLPTLIFDEIDAGVSGRVAEAVGRRMYKLSERQQVICVTHQAQLARFAAHHYSVTKAIENGRTRTTLHRLNREERVGELAALIGGDARAATPRETARWMLENLTATAEFESEDATGGVQEKLEPPSENGRRRKTRKA